MRSIAERGQRHVERMANVIEKVLPHVEEMHPSAILDRTDQIEKLDRVARRTFGLGDSGGEQGVINLTLLCQELPQVRGRVIEE